MAKLFKDNLIKEKLQNFEIPNFEEKIEIIKKWNNLYKTKNLQNKKEEELEAPFGDDFFGNILGYKSLTQDDVYNRKFQPKVPEGGQKADLGLGFFSNEQNIMKVIVELKDANTSLDKPQQRAGNLTPIQQAFKYKPYFKECDFVIVSNFYETRIYLDSYYDFEVWILDSLVDSSEDYFNFRKFYYLLSKDNLINIQNISNTKSLLSTIRTQEKEITKKFYSEYSILRKDLFKDIIKNNTFKKSELDLALNKTQKIIDRMIFIHFCEDLGLLPSGKLKENILKAEEIGFSPWEVLKIFFRGVDRGSEKLGIPDGYNGGLFHEDSFLDNLKVGDKICNKFIDLGAYNFKDDLSVNILGHIFEQSISDIEEIKEQLSRDDEIKETSKRKKDGIFYTPEYIVDYIVKNSVGKKIDEWEEELKQKYGLKEDITDKNYTKRAIEVYEELQEKVKNIKVLDPACGSGAFLVKVFDFLLEKNKEISKKLEELGVNQGLFSTESYLKTILQNNIYGVDLNEESVEITKLSLWLKTAQKGKKLANLDSNIKCGNSLIDDENIAGSKAFVWEKEFSEIFADGGFDVIVGNPPYGAEIEKISIDTTETYLLFYKLGINILKKSGILSFITPDSWLVNNNASFLREMFIQNGIITDIYDVYKVFVDAPDVWCNIVVFQKDFSKNKVKILRNEPYNLDIFNFTFDFERIKQYGNGQWFVYINDTMKNIFDKMNINDKIGKYFDVKRGFSPSPNDINITTIETNRQIIGGEDFGRYLYKIKNKYLIEDYNKSREQIENIKSSNFIGIQRIRTNSLNFNSKWLISQYFEKGKYIPIGDCAINCVNRNND